MPRGSGRKANPTNGGIGLGKYMPNAAAGDGYNDVEGKTDWSAVEAGTISAALVTVDRCGGALLFGADRQRTQLAITLFFEGQKNTFYWPRTYEGAGNVERWLLGLVTDLNKDYEAIGGV